MDGKLPSRTSLMFSPSADGYWSSVEGRLRIEREVKALLANSATSTHILIGNSLDQMENTKYTLAVITFEHLKLDQQYYRCDQLFFSYLGCSRVLGKKRSW